MTSYTPIEIPRRGRNCCKNGEPFKPGDTYFSRLNEKYEREDFCPQCWKEKSEKPYMTSWQGKVPPRTAVETHIDRLEKALEIVKEREDPVEAYLLALYLMRKKWLILRDEYPKNQKRYQLFEVAHTEEMIEVEKTKVVQEDRIRQESIWKKISS